MKGYVILCNKNIELIVIKDDGQTEEQAKEKAQRELQRLAFTNYESYKFNFANKKQYDEIVHWHMQEVDCI